MSTSEGAKVASSSHPEPHSRSVKVFIPKCVNPVSFRSCQATWGGRGTMAAALAMIRSAESDGSTAMTGAGRMGPLPSDGAPAKAPAGPVDAPAGGVAALARPAVSPAVPAAARPPPRWR